MNRKWPHVIPGTLLAFALIGTMLVGAACENNADADKGTDLPPREDFYLLPGVAELGLGSRQVTFTVVGGEPPFVWLVEKGSLGTITVTGERTAVYESKPLIPGVNTVSVNDSSVLRAHATVLQN